MENIVANPEQLETYIAKTISGLEEVLAQELTEIGAEDIQILVRAVSFKGNKEMLYKANFTLRTAQRILKPLFSFPLITENDLYEKIKNFKWEEVLDINHTIAMDAVVTKSDFTHSHFVALRAKDALVDRFREVRNGRRPNVDTDNPDFRINVHIYEDNCDISIDSSGFSLHKRGYRVGNAEAPLSEVLAAGLIRLSGWDKNSNFIDPMCGSGTLLIEAAMYANNFPAGMYRDSYSFMKWKDFDPELWEKVKNDAFDLQVEFDHKIIGYDISRKNLAVAKANIQNARLHRDIEVFVQDFNQSQAPEGEKGILIINPPYGERIKINDIIEFYREIGNTLKKNYNGYKACIISADLRAIKFIGLKPSSKYSIFNGQLECEFDIFELYRGSKKGKYSSENEDNEENTENKRFERKSSDKSSGFDKENRNSRFDSDRKSGFDKEKRSSRFDSDRKPGFDKEKRSSRFDSDRKPGFDKEKRSSRFDSDRKPGFDKEKRSSRFDSDRKSGFDKEKRSSRFDSDRKSGFDKEKRSSRFDSDRKSGFDKEKRSSRFDSDRKSGFDKEKRSSRFDSDRKSGFDKEKRSSRFDSDRKSGFDKEKRSSRFDSDRKSGSDKEKRSSRFNSDRKSGFDKEKRSTKTISERKSRKRKEE